MERSDEPFVIEDEPAHEDVAFLEDAIYRFNVEATGLSDGRELAIFVRGPDGEIRAGLAGHTWGGCCEVKLLWLHASERRRGLGSRLLRAAEDEARRRGCARMLIGTHTFQAPGFYARHGYAREGEIGDYPLGHGQIFLAKTLR